MRTLSKIASLCLEYPFMAIVILGTIVRLFVYTLYQQVAYYPDSEGYFILTQRLLDANLVGYTGERTPGYPLLIALAGNSAVITVILQTIMGFCTAWYVYKTMLLLNFSRKVSLATIIILNSFIIVILYEAAIFTEALTLFFISYIFYYLFNGFFTTPQNWKKTLWFSFVLGYLILIKPFYIFLPFVIYGLYILNNFSIKRIVNQQLLLLIFPLLFFLGWSYINKLNTGYFVSSTYFGLNVSQNCVYFAEKAPAEYKLISDIYVKYREKAIRNNDAVDMTIWTAHEELKQNTGLNDIELSAKLGEFSKATIRKNPEDYAKQVVLSWTIFWKTSLYMDYLKYPSETNKQILSAIWVPQRLVLRGMKIFFLLIIPLHFVNFIRKRKVTPLFVISSIVFITSILQAVATFGTNARYSYPFEFIMVVSVILTLKQPIIKLVNKYSETR